MSNDECICLITFKILFINWSDVLFKDDEECWWISCDVTITNEYVTKSWEIRMLKITLYNSCWSVLISWEWLMPN